MTGTAPASDQALMRRVQADDTDAFAQLYDRLAPRALGVATSILHDADHAQDAVQESFISLWRSRATYRSHRGEVHTWALGIVRSRAIDTWRRNGRHDRRRSDSDDVAARVAAPDDVQTTVIADDEARLLRSRLAHLPPLQGEVIALAYYGELSQTEIAKQLGLPVGTVKGRMRLGLKCLRERLDPAAPSG